MLLWIILGVSWGLILCAAVCVFRVATYADKRVRRLTQRPRRHEDQAA
jgi:hypothetical protein